VTRGLLIYISKGEGKRLYNIIDNGTKRWKEKGAYLYFSINLVSHKLRPNVSTYGVHEIIYMTKTWVTMHGVKTRLAGFTWWLGAWVVGHGWDLDWLVSWIEQSYSWNLGSVMHLRYETSDIGLRTSNLGLGTWNSGLGTQYLEGLRTWDLQLGTWNGTCNLGLGMGLGTQESWAGFMTWPPFLGSSSVERLRAIRVLDMEFLDEGLAVF
jgi:hypothetical protein